MEPVAASKGASKDQLDRARRSIIPRIELRPPEVDSPLGVQGPAIRDRPPRRRFRTLFLSDTHLGAKGCRADRLLDFLTWHDAETIYLVGDIFDNRHPLRSNWSPAHDAVIQDLMGKVRDGARIVYVPGNHDEVFRRHYGVYFDRIEVVESALHRAADGKRYLVVHGDCFDVVIEHALWLARIGARIDGAVRALNEALNRVRRRRGLADWSLMENMLARINRLITRGDLFEQRLTALAREHAAEGVICGHFHSPTIHERFGVTYANCGDWVESCTAIAEDAGGRLQVINWKDAHMAPILHDLSSDTEAASTLAT